MDIVAKAGMLPRLGRRAIWPGCDGFRLPPSPILRTTTIGLKAIISAACLPPLAYPLADRKIRIISLSVRSFGFRA
jgi:hypothetical protein